MPRFFTDVSGTVGDIIPIVGEDALHISRSLRMAVGDPITICDGLGTDHICEIVYAGHDIVKAKVVEVFPSESEPDVEVTLYASVTKGEKMDFVIQKSVELGVRAIVPVLSRRCIVRLDEKSEKNKLDRWNKIAFEASKQSGRGYVPKVRSVMTFEKAVAEASEHSLRLIAYERGKLPLADLLGSSVYVDAAVFTGPEGGYDEEEIRLAEIMGIAPISLGKRILRAETAPLCVLSIIHYQAELNSKKGYGNGEKEENISAR